MAWQRVPLLIQTLAGDRTERVVVTRLQHLERPCLDLTPAVVDTRDAVFLNAVPADVRLVDLKCLRVRHALPTCVRRIWQQRPDVVFSTLGHPNPALAIVHPTLPDTTRHVVRETIVISATSGSIPWPRARVWAYRRFHQRFDRVVCQSRDMQGDLVQQHGVEPALTTIILDPVDLAAMATAARATPDATGRAHGPDTQRSEPGSRLVATGRPVPRRGFDLRIEAHALLRERNLRPTLLGEVPWRAELVRLAQARGVSGIVELVGSQPNPHACFTRADTFVPRSRFDAGRVAERYAAELDRDPGCARTAARGRPRRPSPRPRCSAR